LTMMDGPIVCVFSAGTVPAMATFADADWELEGLLDREERWEAARCAAFASSRERPSILPPGRIQKSVRCPSRLQL